MRDRCTNNDRKCGMKTTFNDLATIFCFSERNFIQFLLQPKRMKRYKSLRYYKSQFLCSFNVRRKIFLFTLQCIQCSRHYATMLFVCAVVVVGCRCHFPNNEIISFRFLFWRMKNMRCRRRLLAVDVDLILFMVLLVNWIFLTQYLICLHVRTLICLCPQSYFTTILEIKRLIKFRRSEADSTLKT